MIVIIDGATLDTIIGNARWFAGYYVRWQKIADDRYRVKTNYPMVGL